MDGLEIDPLLRAAWADFKSRGGTLVVSALLVLALSSGLSIVLSIGLGMGAVLTGSMLIEVVAQSFSTVVTYVLAQLLTLGWLAQCLKAARGEEISVKDIFSQGKNLVPGIVAALIVGLGTIMGAVFLIVPGVIFGLMCSFSALFVVDRGLDPLAAIQASIECTKGHKLRLFLLFLVFGILSIPIVLLTCGVGYLVVAPLIFIILSRYYLARSQAVAAANTAPPATLEVPAPTPPAWLEAGSVVLLVPLALVGGSPVTAFMLGMQASGSMGVSPATGGGMGLSFVVVPTLFAFFLIFQRFSRYRAAALDEGGVAFGWTPTWPGQRILWNAVLGFSITGDGVMLRVAGRPWTRWVGPVLRSEGELTNEVVLALEARGIKRLDE